MRNHQLRDAARNWSRIACKLGILLTEPKVREAMGDQVKDRVGDFADTIASKYEDAADRLDAARLALQGKPNWTARAMGFFVVGLGVGAGLGVLLAPAAGSETREALRGRAVDVTKKVAASVATATGKIRSVSSMPAVVNEG